MWYQVFCCSFESFYLGCKRGPSSFAMNFIPHRYTNNLPLIDVRKVVKTCENHKRLRSQFGSSHRLKRFKMYYLVVSSFFTHKRAGSHCLRASSLLQAGDTHNMHLSFVWLKTCVALAILNQTLCVKLGPIATVGQKCLARAIPAKSILGRTITYLLPV